MPKKTALKRRRSAAASILLSGLGRIAADLHSYGTLPDEPSKPWPDVLSTLPLHCSSDPFALPPSQESKRKAENYEDPLPVAKRLRLSLSPSSSVQVISYIAEPQFLSTIQDVETASTSLPSRSMINLLPNEILDLVGQWLDDEDLKVATMVCERLRDMFFPIYLKRNKFSPRQGFISLKGLSKFRAFKSYHRFPHPPRNAYLSAIFSRDADTDAELSCLAYALAQFPARAFHSISLCFFRYNLVHAEPLNELLAALVPIQCKSVSIMALSGEHHIDVLMPPVYTPMAWNLTNLTIEGNLNYIPFQPLLFGASEVLEKLTLCSVQATSTSFLWKTLLNTTTFPQLLSFQTSEDIPLPLLLDFLSRHPKVSSLAITVDTCNKPMPTDDVIKKVDLKSLTVISGPPSHIFTVLRSASAAPSLARLSLLLNHLPNMSIFREVLKCLVLCQKVEAFQVTLPHRNCRVSTQPNNISSLLDLTTLAIKVFKITLLESDYYQDDNARNEDIMATWDEWQNYFRTVQHLQLEEPFSLDRRESFFEESCKRYPTLAVSVCLGYNVMANQLAIETGGFKWHSI